MLIAAFDILRSQHSFLYFYQLGGEAVPSQLSDTVLSSEPKSIDGVV